MATRAEQFRTEEQRRAVGTPPAQRRAKKADASSPRRGAGKRERAKADAPLNVTEETRKGSPENLARKARARRTRVRGSAPSVGKGRGR